MSNRHAKLATSERLQAVKAVFDDGHRNMDYVTAETERLAEQILNARSRL